MITVAVAGATGAQGGAAARALLAAGHPVRALTRDPAGPAAAALRDLGADVRRADFDERDSLDAALAGAGGLFAVTTPFGTDLAAEVRQGRALIDAASAAGVGHVVLTSAAHADRGTGVPHYESKHLVERHLRHTGSERASELLAAWERERRAFWLVQPRAEVARLESAAEGTEAAGEEATEAAEA